VNIVCFGAHPDDGEFFAGGTAVLWARAGHRVLFVSMTNGDIGHHELSGGPLARLRAEEAAASARIAGIDSRVLGNHDGELQPTLELRKQIVRIIREYRADLVLTHRPYDYHPDHRYGSMAVQDAAYMVCVPSFVPETPALSRNPVFAYLMDGFQRPCAFRPDAAVIVDDVMPVKWQMLAAMPSQIFEWLPWIDGRLAERPADPAAWPAWMVDYWTPLFTGFTNRWRDALAAFVGQEHAAHVSFAEFFEICEYGRQPSRDELQTLFPMRAATAAHAYA